MFGMDKDTSNSFEMRWIYMGIVNILLYPVVYVRDITALAHLNFLGCASAFYVIFVMVV